MREPEFQGIFARRRGQFVGECLAREVVGGGRQDPVRALPQGRIGGEEPGPRIGDAIRGIQGRRPGVVVGEIPGREGVARVQAGLDFNQRRGAEIRPHELFRARPLHRHRAPRSFGEAGRLHSRLPGMFASEASAEVRHQDAHPVWRDAQRLGELLADASRIAGTGPDRETAVLPFRHRGARLHGGVLHVGHLVRRLQPGARRGQPVLHRTPALLLGPFLRPGMALQVVEEIAARSLLDWFPLGCGGDRRQGFSGGERGGRGAGGKIAVAHDRHSGHLLRFRQIHSAQRRPVGRRAQHAAVEHARPHDIAGKAMGAGDQLANVRPDLGRP